MAVHHEQVVSNLDVGVRFYASNVTTSGYVPFHWHSSIELVCVMAGKLTVKFDGKSHIVGPHQFMVVSSGVVHDVTNSPNRAFVLQIPLSFMAGYLPAPEMLNFQIRSTNSDAYRQIMTSFMTLNEIVTAQRDGYRFDVGIQLLSILKTLLLNFAVTDQPLQKDTSGIKEIIVYINVHYVSPLTVDALAHRFGYNASYLSRLFKAQTGVTLIHYIYNIRLNAFYQDLIKSSTSIDKLYTKHGLTINALLGNCLMITMGRYRVWFIAEFKKRIRQWAVGTHNPMVKILFENNLAHNYRLLRV